MKPRTPSVVSISNQFRPFTLLSTVIGVTPLGETDALRSQDLAAARTLDARIAS